MMYSVLRCLKNVQTIFIVPLRSDDRGWTVEVGCPEKSLSANQLLKRGVSVLEEMRGCQITMVFANLKKRLVTDV